MRCCQQSLVAILHAGSIFMLFFFPVRDPEHNALNWLCEQNQPWKSRADIGDRMPIGYVGFLGSAWSSGAS